MSRRKGWLFFVLGLVLALGAGALVFVVLSQAQERTPTAAPPPPPSMQLPVAARPLDPGVTLGPSDYVMVNYPLDLVPLSAITQTADLDNQFLVGAVGQGETFRKDLFLGSQGQTISQQIPAGKVLFAFPIVDLLSKNNLIQDGDHIDLMLTITPKVADGQVANQATGFTLQNIEVFKVLRSAAEQNKQAGDPIALLCSVSPQDAVLIKSVKDSGGTIDVTLRSPADQKPFEDVPPINQSQLIDKYKLK